MNPDTKKQIKQVLFDWYMDTMWGDGLEAEYIRGGINFSGVEDMTNEELIDNMTEMVGDDTDSKDFELLLQAKEQMED